MIKYSLKTEINKEKHKKFNSILHMKDSEIMKELQHLHEEIEGDKELTLV